MPKKALVAAEEKYRVALYRTLELLLPEAEKQARNKKPALLRILTRAAGRGPKALRSEDREDTKEVLRLDWTGVPKPDRSDEARSKRLRQLIHEAESSTNPHLRRHLDTYKSELAALEANH